MEKMHTVKEMAVADVDEIEIRVKGLCLLWRFPEAWQVANSSVAETQLVTCQE
jgi:hypothetical protein